MRKRIKVIFEVCLFLFESYSFANNGAPGRLFLSAMSQKNFEDLNVVETALRDWMSGLTGALVAFSGGVDSALMLSVAVEVLGQRVLAVTFDSGALPRFELDRATRVASDCGARHHILRVDLLDEPFFRENPPERCYHCKKALFARLDELARRHKLEAVLEGSNQGDLDDYRPGLKAVREMGARSPFLELGLDKAQIRALARRRGLDIWNAPARACLATRIPHGEAITRARLSRIERLEQAILAIGFSDVRVRDSRDSARIELPADEISRAMAAELREQIAHAGENAGYRFVAIDLRGYRRGSLNPKSTNK